MASFPSTSLLSDFSDPPENPLYEDGKWAQTRIFRPPLRKAGGSATDSIHGDPNYSHWTPETFTGNVEAWGCSDGGQLGAALETWRVFAFSALGLANGYQVYYGGGIGKALVVWRYDNDVQTTIAASVGDPGYPSGIGLRINGDAIEGWASYGDPLDPASWVLLASADDPTYRGNFYIGIAIEDPTSGGLSFGCFGGGTPHRTQFFRWLYN